MLCRAFFVASGPYFTYTLGKIMIPSPIPWLLEEDNPSVRYFTLRDVLAMPETNPQVQAARTAIMESQPVKRILSRQQPEGYWYQPENYYISTKYKGTVWSLLLLADLGADGRDERVHRACEFLLKNARDAQTGTFAYYGADHNKVVPCLTGNLLWAFIRLGYRDDERIRQGLQSAASFQRTDDGDTRPPKEWPYTFSDKCWGRHTCMMGLVKVLKAVAEVPASLRTPEMNAMADRGVEFLLAHHLFKRSHDLSQIANPQWTQLGFPLFWQTDVIEMLDILLRLGASDARMQEAIDWVLSKRDEQGRWYQENDKFQGRTLIALDKPGAPSKWVTLRAVQALKRLRLDIL
jgi:hypothetical protein